MLRPVYFLSFLLILTIFIGCKSQADKDFEKVTELITNNRVNDSIQLSTDCIEKYPNDTRFYYERGYSLLSTDIETAKNDFSKCISIDPKYPDGYYGLAMVYKLEKQYNLAENNYNKAIETASNIAQKDKYAAELAEMNKSIKVDKNIIDTTSPITNEIEPIKNETVLNDNNNAPRKIYKIGGRGPAGGLIFYDSGNSKNPGGWRYLEAAPSDISDGVQWFNGNYIKIGTGTGIGSGKSNTKKIIEMQGEGTYAAKLCADYRAGGKSDWFLPSKDELNAMCENLHKIGAGNFANLLYWSSSENDGNRAWYQNFDFGNQLFNYKNHKDKLVRAIRAF